MAHPEIHEAEADISRIRQFINGAQRVVGRGVLAASLASGAGIVAEVAEEWDTPAAAENGGYPWAHARDHKPEDYEWWIDENGNGAKDITSSEDDLDETTDPNGYFYKNCTSYVAWRIGQLTGSVPLQMGNGGRWDDTARDRGIPVDRTTPEPGDAAVWDSMGSGDVYGHVAFVESVNADGTANISQYNIPLGQYSEQRGVRADWYVDFNGTGVGINGAPVSGGGSTQNSLPATNGNVPLATIGEGGEVTDGNWVYTKAGGRVWPIEPLSQWTQSDNDYWSGGHAPSRVSTSEIHANEVGYGGPESNPPGNGSIVYYDGPQNSTQYYFYGGNAYQLTPEESAQFRVMGHIPQRVPMTQNRLDPFTYGDRDVPLSNRLRYRFVGGSLVRMLSAEGGGGFHAWNVGSETQMACLDLIDQSPVITLPESARQHIERVGRDVALMNQNALCAFRPNMVLNGPGGTELWQVRGDGRNTPYTRHHYQSYFPVYLNNNGTPDFQQLRSVPALNEAEIGAPVAPVDNRFFRIRETGQVFHWINNQLRHVQSNDTLQCVGNPTLFEVPQSAAAGVAQGAPAACGYEGRIIRVGTSDYYVRNSQSHLIQNPAIRDCLIVRSGTGQPVPVTTSVSNNYVRGADAHCTYEGERGLNFVRENGTPTVWLVRPDGTKMHVGSLCVQGIQKRWNVFVVPQGETAGHRNAGDWHASQAACDALPS